MSERRKSTAPSRRPRGNAATIRPKKTGPKRETKAPTASEESLAERLARAEEELGHMLVQLSKAEERARQAEEAASVSGEPGTLALIAERDALKNAMREAATILLRAITPGVRQRVQPPPIPTIVDVSEIAEMVDSLTPPPVEA